MSKNKNEAKKVWIRSISRQRHGETVYSVGEYVSGKWRNIDQVVQEEWGVLRDRILDAMVRWQRRIELVGYRGEVIPDWMRL